MDRVCPWFVSSRGDSPASVTGPSIICPVYSDGDALIGRMLGRFKPVDGCRYLPAPPRRSGRYFLHGYFVFPIAFVGSRSSQVIDFAPLGPVLCTLQLHLSRSGLPGEWPEPQSAPG